MKYLFTTLFTFSCILLNASTVEEFRLVDVSLKDTLNLYGQLSGKTIRTEGKLSNYRFNLQLLPNTESDIATAIIEEMLMINGISIVEENGELFYPKQIQARFTDESPPNELKKRLSNEHLGHFKALGVVDSIELKDMNTIQVIDLIQSMTNKVAVKSIFLPSTRVNLKASKVTSLDLITMLDAELRSYSIYMFSGENDTLVFLKKPQKANKPE